MRQTACPHKPLCQTHCTSNSAVRPTERLVYCTARPMAFGDSPANTHLSAKYLRCQAHSPIHLVDKRDIRINHQRCAALDHIVTTGVLYDTKEREEEHWAPNTGHILTPQAHRTEGISEHVAKARHSNSVRPRLGLRLPNQHDNNIVTPDRTHRHIQVCAVGHTKALSSALELTRAHPASRGHVSSHRGTHDNL